MTEIEIPVVVGEDTLNKILDAVYISRCGELYPLLVYGEPGTGKTYFSIRILSRVCGNSVKIDCSMISGDEVAETIILGKDGTEYKKSPLVEAREKGKSIILDEIDKLPLNAQQAMLPIMDRYNFTLPYSGKSIKPKPSPIIATANEIDGLIEPLMDRFYDQIEMKLGEKERKYLFLLKVAEMNKMDIPYNAEVCHEELRVKVKYFDPNKDLDIEVFEEKLGEDIPQIAYRVARKSKTGREVNRYALLYKFKPKRVFEELGLEIGPENLKEYDNGFDPI